MAAVRLGFDPIEEAQRQWEAHDLDETAAMAAATSIMRAHQLVVAAVDATLRPFELTFARFEVLMLLSFSRNGSLPMAKMSHRLMVHPTSVTNLVDKLEAQGFLERRAHATDRRTTLATITPTGRRVARRAAKALTDARFGMALDDAELQQMTKLVRDFRDARDDFGE